MLTSSHLLPINYWISFPISTVSKPIILKNQPLEYGIHIQKADIATYYSFFFSINTTVSTCGIILLSYNLTNHTVTGVNTHFLSLIFTSESLNVGAKFSNIPSNLHPVLELLSQPSSPESILVHFEVAFSL